MRITNRTIFIAGATSGIGRNLAERLHAAGNHVVVSGRRADLLDEIRVQNPGIDPVVLDTTGTESIHAAIADVTGRFPKVDVLIAMAGIMVPEDLHTAEFLPTAEQTITTNLLGPIRLIAALTEHLQAQPASTIITVTSGLAFVPLPATPTYNATKAAIHSFTESLRVQLQGTSVDVLELVPPAVRTSLMGQENAEDAVPLDDFLDEVMGLLEEGGSEQILVEAVRPLRYAETNGQYAPILAMLSQY